MAKKDYQIRAQKAWEQRTAEAGIVRVGVWVPECRRDDLLALAMGWRDDHKNGVDIDGDLLRKQASGITV